MRGSATLLDTLNSAVSVSKVLPSDMLNDTFDNKEQLHQTFSMSDKTIDQQHVVDSSAVQVGRPFLQELRDNSVTGEIRCVAWHPEGNWLAAAGGWEVDTSPEAAAASMDHKSNNETLEKAYVMIWGIDDASEEEHLNNAANEGQDEAKDNQNPLLGFASIQEDLPLPPQQTRSLASSFPSSRRTEGKMIQKYQGGSAWNCVAWSPDGNSLALCAEKVEDNPVEVYVWEKDSMLSLKQTEPRVLHAHHQNDIKAVAFSNDGTRLASAAWDNTVIICWLNNQNKEKIIKKLPFGIFSISWSPPLWPLMHHEDIVAIGSEDLDIHLWRVPKNYVGNEARSTKKLDSVSDDIQRECLLLREKSRDLPPPDDAYQTWQDYARGQPSTSTVHIQGHEGSLTSVAWHPAKPLLASGSWDNSVAVWDLSVAYEEHYDCLFLQGHKRNVNCVSWNCKGDLLASGSDDGTIVIWVVETATKLQVLEGHQGPVLWVDWHPKHNHVLASGSKDYDTQTIIWNHKAMEEPVKLRFESMPFMSCRGLLKNASTKNGVNMACGRTMKSCTVRWSPSGNKIVFRTHQDIFLWDMSTEQQLEAPQMIQGRWIVTAITWLPNKKKDHLAVAKRNLEKDEWYVEIWDTNKFSVVTKPFYVSPIGDQDGHQNEIRDIAFSPDCEMFATGGNDEDIFLWSYHHAKLGKVLSQHTDWVRSLRWCPSKQQGEWWLASASDDSSVIIWIIVEIPKVERRVTADKYRLAKGIQLGGHRGSVYSVVWGPSEVIASSSFDQTITLWDLNSIDFHEDKTLTQNAKGGCEWKSVFAQRETKQDGIRHLDGHKQEVWDIDWTKDGKTICSCSEDNTVIIWDAVGGKLQQVLASDGNMPVRSVFWNPHGKSPRLATATLDDKVSVHCILRIPSLTSQKKAAEHLANTRAGRALLAELVRSDLLSLGTKQGGETLAHFLLESLATSDGKQKSSFSRALNVLLKGAIEEGDFFYNCKDHLQSPSEQSLSRLKRLVRFKMLPKSNRCSTQYEIERKPISILKKAVMTSDIYAIKAVLEFVTAGLTAPQGDQKRTTLMQSIARKALLDDLVLLLQRFPDEVDAFLKCIGLCKAPASVLKMPEGAKSIDLTSKERLLLASNDQCQIGLWMKNWQRCQRRQGLWARISLISFDPYHQHGNHVLKPQVQALMAGFPDCLSHRFLQEVMASSKQEALFHVPLIRLIYEYKWEKCKLAFQFRFLLYICYLVCATIFMLSLSYEEAFQGQGQKATLTGVIIGLNCYFFASEFAQIFTGFKGYFKCFWNYVDLSSTLLTFVFFVPLLRNYEMDSRFSEEMRIVGALVSVLNWIKVLHFCMASRVLAALVQTVLVIIHDIRSFLLILAIFFLGFGVAFNVLVCFQPTTFDQTLLQEFVMILGDFESFDFEESISKHLGILLFVIFQFVVTIVLLNALIAIMGDSFDKAQQESFNNFHVQRARIVEEMDQEIRCVKRFLSALFGVTFEKKNKAQLHVLVAQGSTYSLDTTKYEKGTDEWKGRNAKITGHINLKMTRLTSMLNKKALKFESLLQQNQKYIADQSESLNRRIDKIDKHYNAMNIRMDHQNNEIQLRLEKLETLIVQNLGSNKKRHTKPSKKKNEKIEI